MIGAVSSLERSLESLDRCGNALCLDFVNTVHSRVEADPHEYLRSYSDLLRWARGGGVLSEGLEQGLRQLARQSERQAEQALSQAIQLREALYRLFRSILRREEIASSDLQRFNRWLAQALPQRRVSQGDSGLEWSWQENPAQLERPLWPVVLSAAELLAEGDRSRIKECPSDQGCGWIFLDVSKNASRKWCNMRTCGNLAKARRFYQRQRSEK